MSMICTSGAIRLITPWQVPTKSSCRPKSVRNVTNMPAATASTSPSRSWVRASATTSSPAARAARVVCGPIETAGSGAPSARTTRAAEPEASTTEIAARRRPASRLGAVERDEVRVERVDEQRARPFGAGEEHAPGGPRQLASRPSCVETRGTRSGSIPARGAPPRFPGRSRRSARSCPSGAARAARAVRARHDDPVVAARVDRSGSSSGSIRISGQTTTSSPSASSRATSGRACSRGRVTTTLTSTAPTELRSARPSSAGSSPLRRSIHAPSSSATSAVRRLAVVVRRHRREAAAADRGDARALGLDATARLRVVDARRRAPPRPRAPAARARPGPPPAAARPGRSGSPISRAEAEPVEPARGEDDRVEPALAALAQARVDVAAQRLDRERRLEREQLRAPAHRGGADAHPGPELGRAAERVARILARQVRADREPVGVRRGHVLRGVHGDVDAPVEQRLLELLHEDAARADLAERPRAVAVARGRDRHERDLDARRARSALRGELGLREREPTAAGADANQHGTPRDCRDARLARDAGPAAGRARTRSAPGAAAAARSRAREPAHASSSSPSPNRWRTASA